MKHLMKYFFPAALIIKISFLPCILNAQKADTQKTIKKSWTLIIHMAADNSLNEAAFYNINQMLNVGSNDNFNIIVQLDTKDAQNNKYTHRYYIEHNNLVIANADDPTTQAMDSGNPQTLISLCAWAITNYPANYYALILWDHGSGILDPIRKRSPRSLNLFHLNATTGMYNLDRTTSLLTLISPDFDDENRGICWDDTTGNYLTNQKLVYALQTVCTNYLHNKFDIIGFDACLMSMLEVGDLIKNYAQFMVGSQESEPDTGWNYQTIFTPLLTQVLDPKNLALTMVNAYQQEYISVIGDYTQSALDLANIDSLENNINTLSTLLIQGLKKQKKNSFSQIIAKSKRTPSCIHFAETSYIDLYTFYDSLTTNLATYTFTAKGRQDPLKKSILTTLSLGKILIEQIAFANAAGQNLARAKGISIYFPDKSIYPSYQLIPFTHNAWFSFLQYYLKKLKYA